MFGRTAASQATPFRSVAATHPGAVRSRNEDAFLERPDIGLWAVADGVGGHADGAVASALVMDHLSRLKRPRSAVDFIASVRRILEEANEAIRRRAHRAGGEPVATTIVVLLVKDEHFAAVWAGDSRLYLHRDGRLRQVTRDHSLVQELLDAGEMSPATAVSHPAGNIVTRALGADDCLDLETVQGRIARGDIFLLCSDGLSKMVDDAAIERLFDDSPFERLVGELVAAALAHGGTDNVTAVAVTRRPEDER